MTIRRDLRISAYMTPSPHTIGRDRPLSEAHRIMRDHAIRHLPVLDGAQLVGVVTLRDLHFIETLRDAQPELVLVEEAMTPDPYVVAPNESLERVAQVMAREKYGSAIVAQGGRVVGVFTLVDGMRALAALLAESRRASRAPRARSRAKKA
jgi:acetoin utilization protein AcuB